MIYLVSKVKLVLPFVTYFGFLNEILFLNCVITENFAIFKFQILYSESVDIHETENIVDFAVFEIFFPIKKILVKAP